VNIETSSIIIGERHRKDIGGIDAPTLTFLAERAERIRTLGKRVRP
jgi:hypothetical protein